MKHQILVGNIGNVLDTASQKEAQRAFSEYKAQSKEGYGRASGEPVTWFKDGEIFREYAPKPKFPRIGELRALFISLKSAIEDDFRADEFDESDTPSMCVTIGANERGEWSYQTGDNSFTGGAYGFPDWAVVTLHRRSNSTELAREVVSQLADLMHH